MWIAKVEAGRENLVQKRVLLISKLPSGRTPASILGWCWVNFLNWQILHLSIQPIHLQTLRRKCCLVVRCSLCVSCLNIARRCIPNVTHIARTTFVAMALSFHSTIEGLALALEDEASGVWLNTGIVRSILFKRCIWRNLRCHSSSQICHLILCWDGAGV